MVVAVPDEVEVKLEATPEAIEAIARLRSTGAYRLAPRRVQELHTVYLDTATHALAHAGIALRLRRDGRRWEATAKWPGRVSGGLHARPELTVPLAGDPVLPFVLPAGPLRDHLHAAVLDRPLQPVLVTEVRRRPFDLLPARGARPLAEVALDTVQLCHPDGTAAAPPYGEVEIERRTGSADDCLEAGRLLRRQFDLIPSASTKYLRGMVAVYGDAAPRRLGGTTPEPTMPLAAALRAAVATQLERWRAAAPATRAGDQPEALHEMRVAMRRLRTALRAFPAALPARQRDALQRELTWLGGELGRVRDFDVLLTRADHLAAHTSPAARAALGGYRRHLLRAR
ncbi:MAG: CHAD domain-containing protein, partial [Deltaproteobacteria bacterium]|nr:CHAD domain-containing protein [Deltaproteobacteria bacterium]